MDPREKNNLNKKLAQMIRLYDRLYLEHKTLLNQYEKLKEDFGLLANFKGGAVLKELITRYPHLFTETKDEV